MPPPKYETTWLGREINEDYSGAVIYFLSPIVKVIKLWLSYVSTEYK